MTSKEQEVVDRLIYTGLTKNVAKSLAIVFREEETRSVDIEHHTGLRQPEVSIAMQQLRRKGWVKKKDIKKEGKGRPTHSYTLKRSKEAIFAEIEKGERKKVRDVEKNLEGLKKLML
ncbi:MAG: ArsR family transcriptional regulator [Thermoplasmata archaeon]|nr:ArsR family transcriptional regulator [Thermoplasmata archaeon]